MQIMYNRGTEQRELNSCCNFREGFPDEKIFEQDPSVIKMYHSYWDLFFLNILSVLRDYPTL